MNTRQVARKRLRLPGEIAFDLCFLPLVALTLFNIIFSGDDWRPPFWHGWLWFGLGLVLAALWFRAVFTLVRAWRDPSSRVLRFSTLMLLFPFAVATSRFLLAPFR